MTEVWHKLTNELTKKDDSENPIKLFHTEYHPLDYYLFDHICFIWKTRSDHHQHQYHDNHDTTNS